MRLAVFSLFCTARLLAQPAVTDFIPTDSKVVLGINLRRLIDQTELPLGKVDSQSLPATILAQNGLSGLDPLKDVDSVVIATTGAGEQPPAVAILRGRFAALTLGPMKDPKSLMVKVDDSTMLAGPPDLVHAAMERRGGSLDAALLARIAALSAAHDFWGVGAKLETVDRFEFGASFQDGLTLDAEFHPRASKDTDKLLESVKFFQGMIHDQKFNVQVHNGTMKISLHIPKEELKKAIAAGLKPPALPAVGQPSPGKIVTNANGETVSVTLPGGH